LTLAEFEKHTAAHLKDNLPSIVNIANPLDLLGDANDEHFKIAIESSIEDNNIDVLIVILLPQTPTITINIINILRNLYEKSNKPIVLVVPGGSFADTIKKELEEYVPAFSFPINAVVAIKGLVEYSVSDTNNTHKKSNQKQS